MIQSGKKMDTEVNDTQEKFELTERFYGNE